ncbi:MAG: hypothetical protein U1F07_07045 [Rubrivivax sp.]
MENGSGERRLGEQAVAPAAPALHHGGEAACAVDLQNPAPRAYWPVPPAVEQVTSGVSDGVAPLEIQN